MIYKPYSIKIQLTGITRKASAEILSAVFSCPCEYNREENSYIVKDKVEREWTVGGQEPIEKQESAERQEMAEEQESIEGQGMAEEQESIEGQETAEEQETIEGQETAEEQKPIEGQEIAEEQESIEGQETAEEQEPIEGKETAEGQESIEGQDTAEERQWKVEQAISILCQQKKGDKIINANFMYSVEISTPFLYERDFASVESVVKRLEEAGAFTNESTNVSIALKHNAYDITDRYLNNLCNLMKSKEKLIQKSLGVFEPPEPSNLKNGCVTFPKFSGTLSADKIKTYLQLVESVNNFALSNKRVSPRVNESPNDKFVFRTWLIRLGMIGDEYKTARAVLTENLEGNSAWLHPETAKIHMKKVAEEQMEQEQAEPEPEQTETDEAVLEPKQAEVEDARPEPEQTELDEAEPEQAETDDSELEDYQGMYWGM